MAKHKKSAKRKPLVEIRWCSVCQTKDGGEYFFGYSALSKSGLPDWDNARKVRVEVREILPKRKAKR